MSDFLCPRRDEMMSHLGRDAWRRDNTCSYCGSMNPDTFMARVEAGTVQLTPTDKSYKVYVENDGGEPFMQSYRDCKGEPCNGPQECAHWVQREASQTKFYFQHLSEDQKRRFVDLMNEKGRLKLRLPGYFYVLPFFCRSFLNGPS